MAGVTCVAGGMCGSRGHAWWGACMAKGGMHGRGHVWWGRAWRQACVAGGMHGGGHAWQEGVCVAGETATAADGTHPTGMHSC